MPMRYANESDVLGQLGVVNPSADYSRLERLESGLCDTFDHKVGRSFGVAPVAQTRTVSLSVTWSSMASPRIILETPIRSVTSITVDGTWNGTAWTGGTVLAADDYLLTNEVDSLFYGIDLGVYGWSSRIRVSGVWGDQSILGIPDDVREALTFITVDEWRTRNASPAGEIGPDGLMVRARNPRRFELVTQAIERHHVARVLVG